jgi:hypothetical protein
MPELTATYAWSTWLFLRLIGLIYLAAFVSLGVQIRGLIGQQGITPIAPFLDEARSLFGRSRFAHLPTLAWLNSSDRFLAFLCWGGAALALGLIAGVAPPLTAALLWLFYLSLFHVCPLFLGYQWDVLLLETGFLAIWLAPLEWLPQGPSAADPHPVALWLAWWLLFRLMFASGVVKLRSGDRTWRNLTALAFHYETQPLPTPLAWFAHRLPTAFHQASCAGMFAVELVVPFLIVAPVPLSYLPGALTIALMLGIMATGNYCFFNLLTIALSLLVFDDAFFSRLFQTRDIVAAVWPSWAVIPVAALLALLSLRPVGHLLARGVRWPAALRSLFAACEPWHLVSGYGLFAVMTTERREIVVEGSDDGATWQTYEFKWKPCDPLRAPRYCMPHQPRLDWQMWFAALADYRASPWFLAFLARLLENSPAVVTLLRRNPFADRPPRYVRAVVYRYRFADRAARRQARAWWTRERLGLYCPVLTKAS